MDETDNDEEYLDRADITDRLPGYRLIRQLSETGMSEVFLAEDTSHDRRVALKVVGSKLLRGPSFRDRFRRESAIAITLEHPNIVPAYAAGESADGALGYLVMRYIHGSNLLKVLTERGALSMVETITLARQVAAALDTAHDRGLIHRDVKPANVIIEHDGNHAYLCDFGIAKNTELATITSAGDFLGTPHYAAPEQADSGTVDRRADVYSLGCVIRHCLTGRPPYVAAEVSGQFFERRMGPIPLPVSSVARVLRKATALNPAERYATCHELVHALETARSRRHAAVLPFVVLGSVLLLILMLTVVDGGAPEKAALARVPAALRDDCRVTDVSMVGAASSLSCQDMAGQSATSALFTDRAGAEDAYARIVDESGVAWSEGDCASATGAEHRYPATGRAQGRVLCFVHDGVAMIVWSDYQAHTVTRSQTPVAEDASLRESWSRWTATEAFPTGDERALLDVAAGSDCVRAPAVELDEFPSAVAGVTCVPAGVGAREVSYFRFASVPELQESFTGRVQDAKAPSGISCVTGDAERFIGTRRHDWLGVDIGQVLCHSRANGTLAMEWSMEPLSVIGRVVGNAPVPLAGWWEQWHLAPLGRIVEAVNARSQPPFPSQAEKELLAHIPPVSRAHCIRPSPEQVWRDIGAVPAVGVACGQTSGAGLVVYYQFKDAATMRLAFNSTGDRGTEACTDLPGDFSAEKAYSRANGSTGRLRCGVYDGSGERFLEWTDARLGIGVFAYQGSEPFAMIDWWTHDAGPI